MARGNKPQRGMRVLSEPQRLRVRIGSGKEPFRVQKEGKTKMIYCAGTHYPTRGFFTLNPGKREKSRSADQSSSTP
jgi:hypothetical protein